MTHHWRDDQSPATISTTLECVDRVLTHAGQGNGPIDAFVDALDLQIRVHSYEERAIGHGSDADAIAMVEIAADWL